MTEITSKNEELHLRFSIDRSMLDKIQTLNWPFERIRS
jgi:hypothetical protein